jgi:cytochrome c oxidase assembly protein subunit 11
MTGNEQVDRSNRRTVLACTVVAIAMVGVSFAAVPLYDLFCRATGFGGTPMIRTSSSAEIVDRTIGVRLDANVAPGLSWRFTPETPEVSVRLGETTTVLYRVTNEGSTAATGIASFNVQPPLTGGYFVKLECFCFQEHTLQPGETIESAVVFYVEPALAQDDNVKDTKSITLSYTYFPAKHGKAVTTAATSPTLAAQ